jgi:hypothetical protein
MDGEILHERRVPPSGMLGILAGDTLEGWMDGSVHGLPFPCFFPFFLFSFLSFASGGRVNQGRHGTSCPFAWL